MEFFTSDTHFWHTNIIKYCNRPFSSIEEMNEALINNWNEVVCPDDTVYHLGDVAMGKREGLEIVNKLNGKKILVRGNHDRTKNICSNYFSEVHNQLSLSISDKKVLLKHIPANQTELVNYDYQLCGHVHNDFLKLNKWINVGVDKNSYRPVSINQINLISQIVGDVY